MERISLDIKLEKFNEENVKNTLADLNLTSDNFFVAMTKPSLLKIALIGNIAEIFNRYCIVSFNNDEINLLLSSSIDTRKITDIIKINRNEIKNINFSNILISYMLEITIEDSLMKFQVYKKVAGFINIKSALEKFKQIYCN